MFEGFIYGLIDPREPEHVRYIGRTVATLDFRLMHHIKESKWFNAVGFKKSYKHNWILSLLKENIKPDILLIKSVISSSETLVELIAEEEKAIAEYKESGARLTNTMNGGCGWTSEQLKTLWNTPEWRSKQLELIAQARNTDAYKIKLTEGKKRLWENEEFATEMLGILQKHYNEPDVRERRLSNLKKARNTKESKEKTSIATKQMWNKNGFKKQFSDTRKLLNATPEGKEIRHRCISKAVEAHKRKIKCVETGISFDSISDAATQMGLNNSALRNHLSGRSSSTGGYHFEYLSI